MIEIPLTQGRVAIVDAADFDRVMAAGPWRLARRGSRLYAIRHARPYLMHRFLVESEAVVDHINGDGLDNRRANLRPATISQNSANSTPHLDNTSGFKGVTRNRAGGRPWKADICVEGERQHLGVFDTPEEAARAYDAAALEAWGTYARTNFPRDEVA